MKKRIMLLMILATFCSCSKDAENNEIVTAKSIEKTPNILEFSKISKAIDNIDAKSNISIEEQMVSYLDENYDENFLAEFSKIKNSSEKKTTNKGTSTDDAVDLDKELKDVGFTELQMEFITKTTALYPLDESEDLAKNNFIDVENIKAGLLNIRNEVYEDTRLGITQKEQLYTYIDLQYATLESIINYAGKVTTLDPLTGKLNFSFKKFVNIVVSVVLTTAAGAAIALVASYGNAVGVIAGAAGGFVSGSVSAFNNSCIKICGTGYCNTNYNDCYTSKHLTSFFKYN